MQIIGDILLNIMVQSTEVIFRLLGYAILITEKQMRGRKWPPISAIRYPTGKQRLYCSDLPVISMLSPS